MSIWSARWMCCCCAGLNVAVFALTAPNLAAQAVAKDIQVVASAPAAHDGTNAVVLPELLHDPIEPVNRVIWGLNKWLMRDVIRPSAKVYRAIVHPPVRTAISNFGRNLTYPGRLVNHLLQARWRGAGEETYRFGCNTVLGVAGLFDVASHFKIPKSEADFGQTLGKWGWKPQAYVMLPFYGPSSERDTVGLAGDIAANPLNYFSPFPAIPDRPLTYLGPSTYASYVVLYNNLSETVDQYVRAIQSGSDTYADLKFEWGYLRDTRKPDLELTDPPDPASLETLGAVFFAPTDPEFPRRAKTGSVWLYTTGHKFQFTYWLQRQPAPVVYIVPGLGSHRLANGTIALAELAYRNGFSAVCVSSPFNYEFMNEGSTSDLPASTPQDASDLHWALTEIDRRLESDYPGRLGARALMGYSMGAFESLFVAGQPTAGVPLLHFDRYVAIDTPVRLMQGISTLDQLFHAPLAWPAAERTERMENALLKVAAMSNAAMPGQVQFAFSGTESKFLVGAAFRLILRDTIYTSQLHHNQGILEHPLATFRRTPLYQEILRYSFQEYVRLFVTPYYKARGLDLTVPDVFARAGDLRRYAPALRANPNVRVIVNENDLLLGDGDLAWLRDTFDNGRLTTFPHGGHLGNLTQSEVQQAIVQALDGLK